MWAKWLGSLASFVGGCFVTWLITKRYSKAHVLITLSPGFVFHPRSFGVQDKLQMSYDGHPVHSLHILKLSIKNLSFKDIVFRQMSAEERKKEGIKFPSLKFKGFRVLGVHTLKRGSPDFYIPISRTDENTRCWLNIYRLRARKKAVFYLVGVQETRMWNKNIEFFPGFLPDVCFKVNFRAVKRMRTSIAWGPEVDTSEAAAKEEINK